MNELNEKIKCPDCGTIIVLRWVQDGPDDVKQEGECKGCGTTI